MSSNYSRKITFRHQSDCLQAGCPGHTMQIEWACTSDTMKITIDDVHTLIPEDEFMVACMLYIESRLANPLKRLIWE